MAEGITSHQTQHREKKVVALFRLRCMPFTMQLLSLLAHNGEVLRIPALFAEIFATWISPREQPIVLVERSRFASVV